MGQGQQSSGAGGAACEGVSHLWIRKGLRWAVLAQAALSNFVTCSQAKNREVEAADHAITWPPPPARRRERETLPRRADLQCLSTSLGASYRRRMSGNSLPSDPSDGHFVQIIRRSFDSGAATARHFGVTPSGSSNAGRAIRLPNR
jgi:hypothetical protein